MDDILVSVLCITYNHKDYIAQAVESFIMQKTNFKFEIIIHDDCSSDGTDKILKKLEKKYPDIIKLVLQSENKYSKNEDIIGKYMLPLSRGKYLAFCEGDDYWIDNKKLQKQVDVLEKYPSYVACTHNTIRLNCFKKKMNEDYLYFTEESKPYSLIDVIPGMNWHTSSLLARKDIYSIMPKFMLLKSKYTGADYFTNIKLCLYGQVFKLKDTMSVYRYGSKNSWTLQNYKNSERYVRILKNQNEVLRAVPNEYPLGKIEINAINNKILKNKFDILIFMGNFKEIKVEPYLAIYRSMPAKEKLIVFVKCHFRKCYEFYRKKRGKNIG